LIVFLMKKSVLLIAILLLFLFPFITAANETQINNGFTCLNGKVGDCTSLSVGEQIFTSLADGKCTSLVAGSSNNGCWPSGSCDIKTTAQAVLALHNSGLSTSNSESWLASQQLTAPDINWFMQINTNSNSSCSVSYSGSSYPVGINADKSLNGGAGTCLTLSSNGNWLSVSSTCYGTPFTVSCNQPFTITNLYQRQSFPTIYVSSSSSSASSGGKITDSVNSSCFGSGNTCNYEATLWASLALNSLGKSIAPFIPYLTAEASDTSNQQFLPYAFLYALTSSSDYLNTLLSQQKIVNNQNYWDQGSSYGSFYDTALALLPIQSQNPPEKSNALDWLMSMQGSDGCWNSGNILDTAFILYSISGSKVQRTATADCVTAGDYCISGVNCNQTGGNILQGFNCAGTINVCCSKNIVLPSCTSQSGQLCASGQTCQGNPTSASGVTSGQTCCIGTCTTPVLTPSDCELAGGTCRSFCSSSEQSSSQSCALGNEICCVAKQTSIIWIWVLAILIVLTLIGIVSRKKLSILWFRVKSKFKKGGSKAPAQGYPRPPFPPRPPMNFQRRPLPPPSQRQKPSEINDVLKKLREIGK
jgi:hypothetical protein